MEVPLPSTAVSRIDFHAATERLFVTFVGSGKTYMYFDVPQDEYQAFGAAPSKGRFFNERIRDRYRYLELETRKPANAF